MKFLLFDLDDTLLDFKRSEAAAITETLRQVGIDPTPATVARYSEINLRCWKALERREITREELLTRRFRLLFTELGTAASPQHTQALYEEALSRQTYEIEGARALLTQLAPDYALYLVSNGTAKVQDSRLALSGFGHFFRKVFISQHIGADKPSKRFFEKCFAEIPDFDVRETLLIGDSLSSDIRGGLNAGEATCWFNPQRLPAQPDTPATYEIASLAELPPLLARLR